MKSRCLLITPPFTQLNTPYPATPYLKGFLNTLNISSFQVDLGIEVILRLFSKNELAQLFQIAAPTIQNHSNNAQRIFALKHEYINTVDAVVQFLQGSNPTLAHRIVQNQYLPQASRFQIDNDFDWAFGIMGTQDKAKHLATLYLEDLSDFITECIDSHFGFSRYAERLGQSANSFDELHVALQQTHSHVDKLLCECLEKHINIHQPECILVSVPFPGNLFAAFRIAQYCKQNHASITLVMGGGFPNTELRTLSDVRVFEYFNFITLDDGEAPLKCILQYMQQNTPLSEGRFKRTFALVNKQVHYLNNASDSDCPDYTQAEVGTPDYSDLFIDKYISVIEVANPMHRLWNDGHWNKLTFAHGCYWARCTFCDTSLSYIKDLDANTAAVLCDRMEQIMKQTGQTGFHFVDEAAPPALMGALALELLKRNLNVTWWTNIRFEKNFTKDLCTLLQASGCIAVSGGLEVASPRILKQINKGVSVEQVAQVAHHFTEAGIMVHAYLMYGFPTQTLQETVDALEVVRQLFDTGIVQSGFWHQFAMTAHSPIGLNPEAFGVKKAACTPAPTFAHNDIQHIDSTGIRHEQFSFGLRKSLYNFMHGIGFDLPLSHWFDFKIPNTKIKAQFIEEALHEEDDFTIKASAKAIWLGSLPTCTYFTKTKKGIAWKMCKMEFNTLHVTFSIEDNEESGEWLAQCLNNIHLRAQKVGQIKASYEAAGLTHFELFWFSKPVQKLRKHGLVIF